MQNAFSQLGIVGGVSAPGGRPTTRNALMAQLLPYGLMIGGNILGIILLIVTGMSLFGTLGQLCSLAGVALMFVLLFRMGNEVKAVTNNPQFQVWQILIPIYGPVVLLPQEVTKAKQMRGVQEPTRNVVLYLFLSIFALASDLNDIAKAP